MNNSWKIKLQRRIYHSAIGQHITDNVVGSILHYGYWRLLPKIFSEIVELKICDECVKFHVGTPSEVNLIQKTNLTGERPIVEDLLYNMRSDDVFFDIGAHVGLYSCFVAEKTPSYQVYAFEADPNKVPRLETNKELNGHSINIQKYALSDTDGTEFFNPTRASLEVTGGKNVSSFKCDTRIEQKHIPQPTVLKIDVEGAGKKVLRGMEDALRSEECRLVYWEPHPNLVETDEIVSLMESYGFDDITTINRQHTTTQADPNKDIYKFEK